MFLINNVAFLITMKFFLFWKSFLTFLLKIDNDISKVIDVEAFLKEFSRKFEVLSDVLVDGDLEIHIPDLSIVNS